MNHIIRRFKLTARWVWPLGLFLIFSFIFLTSYLVGKSNITDEGFKLWFSGLASALGLTYFLQKKFFEEDRLFLQLFESYNKRFYEISDELEQLPKDSDSSMALAPVVHKYFDLCIEEYQLYQRGLIPKKVWLYWVKGMKYLVNKKPQLKAYWETMEKEKLCFELTWEYIDKESKKASSTHSDQ